MIHKALDLLSAALETQEEAEVTLRIPSLAVDLGWHEITIYACQMPPETAYGLTRYQVTSAPIEVSGAIWRDLATKFVRAWGSYESDRVMGALLRKQFPEAFAFEDEESKP